MENRKEYRVTTTEDNELPLIEYIKGQKFVNSWFWPNSNPVQFNLNLTDDELLVLRLKFNCECTPI